MKKRSWEVPTYLWLGAYDKSYTVKVEKSDIVNYKIPQLKGRLGIDTNILYFNKDSQGIYWFDQSRYGLCLFNEKTGEITYGNNPEDLYSILVASITPSKENGSVWLGGRNHFSTKIWRMKQSRMQLSVLEEYDLKTIADYPGSVLQLIEDEYGNLWIGTTHYLFFKNRDSDEISIMNLGINNIGNMSKDCNVNILICSAEEIYNVIYDIILNLTNH